MTRSARSRVSFAPLLCFLAIGAGLVACDGGGCDDCKCAEKPAEPAALPVVAESVAGADEAIGLLVRVNGAPITRDDVILSVAAKGRSTKIEPELEKNIAGTLAQRELEAQAARAAGLALDDATKGRLAALDAQRRVLEREALAAAWYRDEVRAKVTVTDEDAQRYYDGNKARIQSEVNVWQILERNQQKADAAAAEIAAGRPFEEVARAGFDKLPNGDAPWDLGFLKWKQVPKPWVATLDKLKPGEASGVITGPGGALLGHQARRSSRQRRRQLRGDQGADPRSAAPGGDRQEPRGEVQGSQRGREDRAFRAAADGRSGGRSRGVDASRHQRRARSTAPATQRTQSSMRVTPMSSLPLS
mgnify:CR=1 FL=1